MSQPKQRTPYESRFRRREIRDISIVFMWIKLGLGAAGLLACLGYFFLGNHRPGSGAGAIAIVALIPMGLLGRGLFELVLVSLSRLADSGMRRHDRKGRSNSFHLIVVTLGGFLFLHLFMLFNFGSGYWSATLFPQSGDYNLTSLLPVLIPYLGFAGLMLYFWLKPEPTPVDLTQEEKQALAEERRKTLRHRLTLLGLCVVIAALMVGGVYIMGHLID